MGFVSAIVINNDLLSDIAADKDFGAKTASAILSLTYRKTECSIHTGCGIGATAIACHHASVGRAVIIGGGNFFTQIEEIALPEELRVSGENLEQRLLRELADKHGYVLHKKRSK